MKKTLCLPCHSGMSGLWPSMIPVGCTAAGNRERAVNESRTWGELIRAQQLQVE